MSTTASYRPAVNPAEDAWLAADDYINSKLLPQDEALDAALESHVKNDIPTISVAPNQGKFLYLLALTKGAQSILEIGTLAGYSTLWLAKAARLTSGRVTTLEFEKKHAQIARENLKQAGYLDLVTVYEGDAKDSLKRLVEVEKVFDFVFIDANKDGYPEYLELVLQLSKAGTVIIADNVVRQGRIADPKSEDKNVVGVQKFYDLLKNHKRLDSTALQTVGSKGYDGFSYSIVVG